MRKMLIVGNWKMNLNVSQAGNLVHQLHEHIKTQRNVEVVIAPSMLALQPVSLLIDRRRFRLAAQDAYYVDEGAYTGEVSFAMLHELVHYAIVGHSERRLYFQESLDIVRDKVASSIRNEISPILCIGENKRERQAGEAKQVIHDQLTTALSDLTNTDIESVVIAYEPVWAISTFDGEIAKPDEIESTIAFIRKQIADLYGQHCAKTIRVLYGGSVDDQIAGGYLALDGCDGALVGSASLNYYKFAEIVAIAERLQAKKT